MICERCTPKTSMDRPGFILKETKISDDGAVVRNYEPCPDCGGTCIAHCCDGLSEQPTVMRHTGIEEDDQ